MCMLQYSRSAFTAVCIYNNKSMQSVIFTVHDSKSLQRTLSIAHSKKVWKVNLPLFTMKKYKRHTFDCICINTNMISIRKKRFRVKQYATSRQKFIASCTCRKAENTRQKYTIHHKFFVIYLIWLVNTNQMFCPYFHMNLS